MGRLTSVILAIMLVAAVAGSTLTGTFAGFSDSETSEGNYMCAGTVNLELTGDNFSITNAIPSKWYTMEKVLINAGTLDAVASVHLKNLVCIEDVEGAGVATSEPELVAEEGGKIGSKLITGLGVDTCNIADFIDVKLWYDSDDDGIFELVDEGKLSDIACTTYELGIIPGCIQVSNNGNGNGNGGGWGSYFEYTIGTPKVVLPLMIAQNSNGGTVSIETEGGFLRIRIDSGTWEMAETAVYVDTVPPPKLAPGSFPYKHNPVTPPLTEDAYDIPLLWGDGEQVYVAVHAAGIDGETAWAKGVIRRFKIEVHFPDIPEGDLGLDYFDETDPNELMWDHWPTNAYQGDIASFNTEFILNGLSGAKPPKDKKNK